MSSGVARVLRQLASWSDTQLPSLARLTAAIRFGVCRVRPAQHRSRRAEPKLTTPTPVSPFAVQRRERGPCPPQSSRLSSPTSCGSAAPPSLISLLRARGINPCCTASASCAPIWYLGDSSRRSSIGWRVGRALFWPHPVQWWARQGLNLRPLRCQHSALPLSYAPAPPRYAPAPGGSRRIGEAGRARKPSLVCFSQPEASGFRQDQLVAAATAGPAFQHSGASARACR